MADEMNGEREALGLSVEKRGGVWVVQFAEGGCRPASIVEVDLWQALQAGRASLAANAGREPNGYQKALDIRIQEGGWELSGSKVPVLYTDSINGRQVCRDDVWLCTTEAFARPSPPEGMAGWRLVPVKPTAEMVAAGYDAYGVEGCYAAMLDAAPPLASEAKGASDE